MTRAEEEEDHLQQVKVELNAFVYRFTRYSSLFFCDLIRFAYSRHT